MMNSAVRDLLRHVRGVEDGDDDGGREGESELGGGTDGPGPLRVVVLGDSDTQVM